MTPAGIQARLETLALQRNEFANQAVNLAGDLAEVRLQLAAAQSELEKLKKKNGKR